VQFQAIVVVVVFGMVSMIGCIQTDPGACTDEEATRQARSALPPACCEAQRDAILAVCASPATPPNLKAACVAAAWIGFVGCLRLPGDA
jgi:hypothetical protein